MANVSKEQKEITKERILKAASQLFTRQGFTATTVSQIAKIAEVSESSIFTYFTSKDHLLVMLVIPASSAPDHLVTLTTPGETVANLMKQHFAEVFPLDKSLLREFIAVLQRSPHNAHSTLLDITHDFDQRLINALRKMIEAFGFADPQMALQIITGIITSNFQQFAHDADMTPAQCLTQMQAQVDYALAGRYTAHKTSTNDQSRAIMLPA